MRFGKDSYNLLMKSSGIAKKAVLHASQGSSRFFGFVFHASSFILPQTCSMMFMSGDWAGQSWSTLIFFTLRNFDVEMKYAMEYHPAAKFGPFYGWECKRQLRLLDILDYWCCLPPCRSLAHPHTGCNPRPWFFPPPNLTVFWVNLGSMRAPVGLLQYLRWLWCNSTEDSSEKSTFCHFSSIHPFGLGKSHTVF